MMRILTVMSLLSSMVGRILFAQTMTPILPGKDKQKSVARALQSEVQNNSFLNPGVRDWPALMLAIQNLITAVVAFLQALGIMAKDQQPTP